MTEYIQNYLLRLQNVEDRWLQNAVYPYFQAYEAAYTNYTSVMDRQRQRDAALADLLVTGLSIASGSLLTMVAGSSLMRAFVVDRAVDIVARLNMNRVFSAMAMVERNKALSFALGKMWDDGAKRLSAEAQRRIATEVAVLNRVPPQRLLSPVGMKTSLELYVKALKTAASSAALDLNDSRALSPAEKDAEARKLAASPFMNVPPPLDQGAADRIELGFYLTMIVNSDRLRIVNVYQQPTRDNLTHATVSSAPVTQSTGARDYPRRLLDGGKQYLPRQPGALFTYKTGGYQDVGAEVQRRVNALTRTRLFDVGFFGDDVGFAKVQGAERLLKALSDRSAALVVKATS